MPLPRAKNASRRQMRAVQQRWRDWQRALSAAPARNTSRPRRGAVKHYRTERRSSLANYSLAPSRLLLSACRLRAAAAPTECRCRRATGSHFRAAAAAGSAAAPVPPPESARKPLPQEPKIREQDIEVQGTARRYSRPGRQRAEPPTRARRRVRLSPDATRCRRRCLTIAHCSPKLLPVSRRNARRRCGSPTKAESCSTPASRQGADSLGKNHRRSTPPIPTVIFIWPKRSTVSDATKSRSIFSMSPSRA